MKLKDLREQVLDANLELVRRGLVLYTFGNASGISRDEGLVVIKPSGVLYESMKPEDLVIVDLDGRTVEGNLRPSSDLPTHLVLYKAFPAIGGVAHTHSRAATSWAQAQREIPCYGTTHADYFHGPVPVTKPLTKAQIRKDYELNTGLAIVRCMGKRDPLHTPGVLVAGHAPFCWGKTPAEAAHNSVLVEEIAMMALNTVAANPKARPISKALHEKHFFRKHGSSAYYGQK
ncbi:MAG TPA: L-ribulose-5-phosphate 4-epimerase [Candidatus Sulfotelmatobacter sp.]|nr:L-ribulose-5-phosphate 4-epimerase [Candidatus Sulfotelmatobacter sp.]